MSCFGAVIFAWSNPMLTQGYLVYLLSLGTAESSIQTGFYWIQDTNGKRWSAPRYYTDAALFSVGDLVAFDMGNVGDPLPIVSNPNATAKGAFAKNLQKAIVIPSVVRGQVVSRSFAVWSQSLQNGLDSARARYTSQGLTPPF